jgi:N-methylhydantoinase A/oxoprolinase/acetone carboxylase beta subunit
MYLALVGCSIFKNEIQFLESHVTSRIDYYWLPQRLHNRPLELRKLVQEEIDTVDRSGNPYDAIVLLYGLCSKGTVGVFSRNHSLVVPKVQDCIAILLGSNRSYRDHFAQKPGTYWFTRGWIETGFTPGKRSRYRGVYDPYKERYKEYRKQFDREVSQYLINEWDQRWIQNYTTLAFIDWGMEDDQRFRRKAEENARALELEFENIQGDPALLLNLLNGKWDDETFLITRPGQKLVPTYRDDVFSCSGEPFSEGLSIRTPQHVVGNTEGTKAEERDPATGGKIGTSQRASAEPGTRSGLGLGIDAGGTYTDAVVYDFSNDRVMAWAKAPTTHDNYALGIEEALEGLSGQVTDEQIRKIGLVSLSTTLATNAIVEGKGGRAGIILIGYDRYSLQNIHLKPSAVIRGKHSIDGELIQPLDHDEARRAIGELLDHSIDAFAVSSEVGIRNPEYEILLRDLISQMTDIPVVCGSELTDELNCVKRANTCFYNARLIPLVSDLLSSVKEVLRARLISAPIMVVKGDGTLMSEKVATSQPIEMILSGPAASVIGGAYLSGMRDGYVVDMGGTTTDVAIVRDGFARFKSEGISIDNFRTTEGSAPGATESHRGDRRESPWESAFRTSVKTVDVHTFGLGGDSYIRCSRKGSGSAAWGIQIGPERVVPISYVAATCPEVLDSLKMKRPAMGGEELLVQPADFFLFQKEQDYDDLHPQEAAILRVLRDEGPLERKHLADRVDAVALSLIRTERLETHGAILRSALTPTDILHAAGEVSFWNSEAATIAVSLYASRMGMSEEKFLEACLDAFYRHLVRHLLTFIFSEEKAISNGTVLANDLAGHFFSSQENFNIGVRLRKPIVFIGAPAHAYAADLQRFIDIHISVPEYNEVANAVGAITGAIRESVTILIRPGEGEGFVAYTALQKLYFDSLDDAKRRSSELAGELVREKAQRAGAHHFNVQVSVEDKKVHLSEDDEVYLETLVTASVSSVPVMKS